MLIHSFWTICRTWLWKPPNLDPFEKTSEWPHNETSHKQSSKEHRNCKTHLAIRCNLDPAATKELGRERIRVISCTSLWRNSEPRLHHASICLHSQDWALHHVCAQLRQKGLLGPLKPRLHLVDLPETKVSVEVGVQPAFLYRAETPKVQSFLFSDP